MKSASATMPPRTRCARRTAWLTTRKRLAKSRFSASGTQVCAPESRKVPATSSGQRSDDTADENPYRVIPQTPCSAAFSPPPCGCTRRRGRTPASRSAGARGATPPRTRPRAGPAKETAEVSTRPRHGRAAAPPPWRDRGSASGSRVRLSWARRTAEGGVQGRAELMHRCSSPRTSRSETADERERSGTCPF